MNNSLSKLLKNFWEQQLLAGKLPSGKFVISTLTIYLPKLLNKITSIITQFQNSQFKYFISAIFARL